MLFKRIVYVLNAKSPHLKRMSFFRNLRSSITRGRSSSRDTTPVRTSRPGSVISSLNSSISNGKRRDSLDSRNESSLLNRSDTFILDESDATTPNHSNCSTLEKKSKKSKVLEKFSTFTKRKKTPAGLEASTFEHHPSDNATNTYYKWQAEGGGNSLDYDTQNDPFNFLYEQQSTLKTLQQNGENTKFTATPPASAQVFDSSTYRKGKMPSDLKKQLKILRDQDTPIKKDSEKVEEEQEKEEEEDLHHQTTFSEADKYRTVTLNSFRKSFRDKFLQQQKEAAHNPAWFVEVDPAETDKTEREERESFKENRRDLLVFGNDNYRPGSRSPIRDLSNRKPLRSPTRSPVKRNDTFKVDRVSRIDYLSKPKMEQNNAASIRIEFKNSITPNMPGRMVPVGVAKPMPVQYAKTEAQMTNPYAIKAAGTTTTTRLNHHSPVRSNWNKTQSPARAPITTATPPRVTRYQTLVQIKNDKIHQKTCPVNQRNSRQPTRVQLNNNMTTDHNRRRSPSFGKHYNSANMQLNSNANSKTPQALKQTYFGDTHHTARLPHTSVVDLKTLSSTQPLSNRIPVYAGYKYHTSSSPQFASATTLSTASAASSVRTTPSHSVLNSNSSSHNNLTQLKYHSHYQNHSSQPRIVVPAQRRSRSPIKIPWR